MAAIACLGQHLGVRVKQMTITCGLLCSLRTLREVHTRTTTIMIIFTSTMRGINILKNLRKVIKNWRNTDRQ